MVFHAFPLAFPRFSPIKTTTKNREHFPLPRCHWWRRWPQAQRRTNTWGPWHPEDWENHGEILGKSWESMERKKKHHAAWPISPRKWSANRCLDWAISFMLFGFLFYIKATNGCATVWRLDWMLDNRPMNMFGRVYEHAMWGPRLRYVNVGTNNPI